MTEKRYITAQELLNDSYEIAANILESDFRPDFIVGVWRGGTPVGIAVQEMLDFCGVKSDHISIRTSSYRGIDRRSSTVRVHGLGYLIKNINATDKLLIVDDVYDTGLSVQAVIDTLKARARLNCPQDIRVATAYYKPEKNMTDNQPDYFIHETDQWLVFPHELSGLTTEEIRECKPCMGALMDRLAPFTPSS